MKPAKKKTARTKAKGKRESSVARLNDPIRIVPLHLPLELYRPSEGIAAPPEAKVTYRAGPLLTAVKVFTIFWGDAWQENLYSNLLTQINQFFEFVLRSELLDQLAEYSVAGQCHRAWIVHRNSDHHQVDSDTLGYHNMRSRANPCLSPTPTLAVW